jgi:hypothetical protein
MNYIEIKKYLSAARLIRYEQACHSNQRKVLKMYQANLKLSQAFYPLLSLFEVVLRNALNEELTRHFSNDPEWLKNQVNHFMSHPSLTYYDQRSGQNRTNDILKRSVIKIVRRTSGNVSQGKIIADLNLGFWTELFETTHYRILQGVPIQIFSNLSSGTNRRIINQKLERIRIFRNRVYHNEPVVFDRDQAGTTIFSLKNAEDVYSDLKDIFIWLGIDFFAWTKKINNVAFEIERAKSINNHYPGLKYYILRIRIGLNLYRERYLRTNNTK